jgi:threonine synthase
MDSIKSAKQEIDQKRSCFTLSCFICNSSFEIDDYGSFYYCKRCGGVLEIRITQSSNLPSLNDERRTRNGGKVADASHPRLHTSRGIWKYFDLIPIWHETNIVSMPEGDTPLVECRNLARALGFKSLYVKFEGLNPTGSFKDRGMTVGVSKANELGYKKLICASTGNTSASLAAYSARANLKCIVLIPKGKIAVGKVAQAVAYGAEIFQVEGNFDECLRMATEIAEQGREILLLNSVNPFRIEGQKTAAFEIAEQLGFVPDNVILPVGNGGNISSLWKGFKEINRFAFIETVKDIDQREKSPRMIGIQAEGASPIARAFQLRAKSIETEKEPHTDASAINIGSPVNWAKALGAIYESHGYADSVSDDEIFAAQRLLASTEGLFVEPASATPIAYLRKISSRNNRGTGSHDQYERLKETTIVCVATGNGLKDPNAVLRDLSQDKIKVANADVKSFEKALLVSA